MFNKLYYPQFNQTTAVQLALVNKDLDGLKYIYSSRQKNYLEFYDVYSNKTQALTIAEELKDLKGIKHVANKIGKDYLQHLYDKLPSVQDKVNKAQLYNDLKGFEYILNPYKIDYKTILYTNTTDSTAIASQLYYAAVDLDDTSGIKYIIKQSKNNGVQLDSVLKANKYVISGIYYTQKLFTAKLLIKQGAQFEIQDIIRSNPQTKYALDTYIKHLNSIKSYITSEAYNEATSFFKTLYSNATCILSPSNGYSIYEIVANATYSDHNIASNIHTTYNDYYINSKQPVQDVIKFISLSHLKYAGIKIFLPSDAHYTNSHYFSSVIKAPHKDNHIYLSYNISGAMDYQSILMHEMGHFFFDALFNNTAKPYFETDSQSNSTRYSKYQISAKETLLNILKLSKDSNTQVKNTPMLDVINYMKKAASLNLNHWAFSYYDSNDKNVFLVEALLQVYYPVLARNKVYTDISQLLSEPEAKKIQLLEGIFSAHKFSQDESYLLERIFDYIHRDAKQYDIELLNRLPELQVKKLETSVLKVFNPLALYWEDYITPEVNIKTQEHLKECEDWLLSGTIKINENQYCILDIEKINQKNKLLMNDNTRCDLVLAGINSFSYSADDKKSMQLKEANINKELLQSINSPAQEKCIENILLNFNVPKEIKNIAFKIAIEKESLAYINILTPYISYQTQVEELKNTLDKQPICVYKLSNFCSSLEDNIHLYKGADISCSIYNNLNIELNYFELLTMLSNYNLEI